MDVGMTALDMFGVPIPSNVDGRPWRVADADGSFPINGLVQGGEAAQSSGNAREPEVA